MVDNDKTKENIKGKDRELRQPLSVRFYVEDIELLDFLVAKEGTSRYEVMRDAIRLLAKNRLSKVYDKKRSQLEKKLKKSESCVII